jgi:sugar O-acyltransferase (sialic acid O-acetyltransferase NeuD family)
MSEPLQILVPLINPNEPEALLAELRVREGDRVTAGQVLASFETTKSTYELTAERDGFILGLRFKAGDTLRSGERLCYLADSAGQPLPYETAKPAADRLPRQEKLPQGLRITQPALALAKTHQVDLEGLPRGVLVTEEMVRKMRPIPVEDVDPSALIIYGGGGHAKSLIDLIRLLGQYRIHGILDDGIAAGTRILGVEVLGGGELLLELRRQGLGKAVNAVGGIGSIVPRLAVYEKLAAAGFECLTVVHPRAFVEPNARIAEGCQVFFNAYVGSEVEVGFGSIINTAAVISHDCRLGKTVNVSPGAMLAGAVTLGDRALIGMGATINLGVTIGAGARVGNSAVVKADVPENGIVRAGATWLAD